MISYETLRRRRREEEEEEEEERTRVVNIVCVNLFCNFFNRKMPHH